jgi:DNA polymerase beta
MNSNIIKEFEKLVIYIQGEIDEEKKTDVKKANANIFRLRNIKNALSIIKKYPHNLTINNLSEFGEISGIGKGTIERITEILTRGHLKELEKFTDISKEKREILENLETVVGIGRNTAILLYDMGIKSVADLKKKVDNNIIEVNDKIKIGLEYYNKFEGNIPRKEITKIYKILQNIVKKVNKKLKLNENNQFILEICGSYRRGNNTSNDIDVLITKVDTNRNNIPKENYLKLFVDILTNNLKENKEKPLLVQNLTDNFETKYMGFLKYLNNPIRRIDIRFLTFDSYYSALLYFTGSAELNKRMRVIAKKKGYKLSEYGLEKNNNQHIVIDINSEADIFKILEMEYLQPTERNL